MGDWKARFHRMRVAVETERAEEEAYYRNLMANKSIRERIETGIAWYPVEISRKNYVAGENVELELSPSKANSNAKSNVFRVGASALLFIQKSERADFKGTISYVSKRKVRIIIATEVLAKDLLLQGGTLGIELIFDDRPYRVMLDALHMAVHSDKPSITDWRKALYQQMVEVNLRPVIPSIPKVEGLNESQMTAISMAHATHRIAIIHGPPGTGKTTTLIGLIQGLCTYENKILVTAPSNKAVDLLAKLIDERGLRVLRIGHVTRMGDSISALSLDEQVRNRPEWQHIKQVKIEAEEAHREAGKFKRKFGSRERQNRGLMYKEAKQLQRWARELEGQLVGQVVDDCQVICATLVGCASDSIKKLRFKTAIIDEGSQALEPECWIALNLAERVIIAGDHMQLPPTVKSKEAMKLGLSETILDRMADQIDESVLLDTQYRMHPKILGFCNNQFYDGRLKSAAAIKERAHSGISTDPIIFIDTSGCGFLEKYNEKTRSRCNDQEFVILKRHMLTLSGQLEGCSIGIISPYKDQVRLIGQEIEGDDFLREFDIEVNSIDGFQGQEKDVIYLSLVRSNDDGELGFLKDYRRLNVAMTRARLKLVIIGDMATLGHDQVFLDLANYIDKNGLYQSAWEYLA